MKRGRKILCAQSVDRLSVQYKDAGTWDSLEILKYTLIYLLS